MSLLETNPHPESDGCLRFGHQGSPFNIIHGEIVWVTSLMRRNARWAGASMILPFAVSRRPHLHSRSSSNPMGDRPLAPPVGLRASKDEALELSRDQLASPPPFSTDALSGNNLISGFGTLIAELRECQDVAGLDASTLLSPFLAVVRSGETNGPITAAALSSIHKFFTYSFIHPHSPSLAVAMSQVSAAGTHCRFETSDSVSDEIVLLKILDVLQSALTGTVGHLLTDEAVCQMMETGLSMCCQMRLSEVLRRFGERAMQSMVTAVFRRLRNLSPAVTDPLMPDAATEETAGLKERLRMSAPDPRSASIPAAASPTQRERTQSVTTSAQQSPIIRVQQPLSEEEESNLGDVSETAPLTDVERNSLPSPPEQSSHFLHEKGTVEFETLGPTDDPAVSTAAELRPYGLPSIKELLRVLVSLLNPYDTQHTDTMRLTALNTLITIFEVAGESVGQFPSLRSMVADELCKHLFQLVRSDNINILSASLRCMTILLDTMKPYMKIHLELLMSYLMDRLLPQPTLTIHKLTNGHTGSIPEFEDQLDNLTWNQQLKHVTVQQAIQTPHSGLSRTPSTGTNSRSSAPAHRQTMAATGQARQLMLEYLAYFARESDFMVNLWVNFDCHVDFEDVFERLLRFLARGVYALNPNFARSQDHSQVICLDTLLSYLNHMFNRLESAPSMPAVDVPAPVLLARDKRGKRILLTGASKFNSKPKEGLRFLELNGMIFDDPTLPRPQSLALFFKTCPRLDKKLLGDYISRPENLEVLKAFMTLFDFRGKLISDCLRELLETFRLPGESQQIARITEVFASIYVAAGAPEVKNEDAAYVLSYSVIMLNTDQHNPQNRKKMTLEDYKRNLRGVNNGKDFDSDYLKAIYESIRKREIVMPEEHAGQLGFEYAWKELSRRSKKAGLFIACNTSIFDRDMFEISWRPIVSGLSYAFTHFNDDHMLQSVVAGFQQCATLASRFQLNDVFDETVAELAKITELIQSPSPDVNFPTIKADGQMLTISPLSIQFGKKFKAQLAAVVLFTVASTDGSALRRGWLYIFEIITSLFAHSLLPNELMTLPDFANVATIPIQPPHYQNHAPERRADTGLLSTLSSYLLSPYVGPADGIGREITDDDIESTLCAIDCLASCHFSEVYHAIFALDLELRENVVITLVELADRRITRSNRFRAASNPDQSPPSSPQSPIRGHYQYDPCSLFLLEFIISVATREPKALYHLWTPAFEHVARILANPTMFSPLLIERAIAGLLRLQSIAVQEERLRDQFFISLDVFRSLPQSILPSVAQPVVSGVCQIASVHSHVFRTSTQWNMLFSIFSSTAAIEDAARQSFEVLKKLAEREISPGVVIENFGPYVQVLDSFASVCCGHDNSKMSGTNKIDEISTTRALEAVDMIRRSQELIPHLLSSNPSGPTQTWTSLWMPVLSAYGQQSINGNREVRRKAVAYLQRSLVAPEILSNGNVDLTVIFERVLFPTLEELLKPQVFRRDPDGMSETRLTASGLLCKIFLHYLVQLSEQSMPRMTELWLQILGLLDRFMHSGRRDQMYEAVPENLKNALLVMHASGFLVPPHEGPSEEERYLWNATFERIDPVLNTLKADLFPPPPPGIPSLITQEGSRSVPAAAAKATVVVSSGTSVASVGAASGQDETLIGMGSLNGAQSGGMASSNDE